MSDIDLTEAVEAAFDETLTERCLVALDDRADSSHIWTLIQEALTAALPRIERQVREQVAEELRRLLPGVLAATVADEFGWLSDALDALPKDCTFNSGNVCFQGEGSIDIFQVGDYAASIARGDS